MENHETQSLRFSPEFIAAILTGSSSKKGE